jgi:O-acetylserine/cysteine efflux transporter
MAVDDQPMRRLLPLASLAAAGGLWGTTIPLTKVVLPWLGPAWLVVVRFALAGVLLLWPARRHLRRALTPGVVASGVGGYGLIILLQNTGVARTSVTHAALLGAAVPALVALMTVSLGRGRPGGSAWTGFAVALAGVGVIALDGGGAASLLGDGLVVLSVLASAVFVVAQPGLLAGRNVVAVTAVQFVAAALAAAPLAVIFEPLPAEFPSPGVGAALVGLVLAGTLVPFTLFAYAQSHVSAEVAGGFLNLEPLVGVVAGAVAFGDVVGWAQIVGALAILTGIGLTTTPLFARPATLVDAVNTPLLAPAPG